VRRPLVAIVGRPNVGKSTLFNRLVGGRISIIDDEPGVTRDRIYGEVEWRGRTFTLVDTGGWMGTQGDVITRQVKRQVEQALQEADLILMVVDQKEGLLPEDEEMAKMVRRQNKPVILVVNKVDDFSSFSGAEFYSLGLGDLFPVSALHGLNTGDLLDKILELLPEEREGEGKPEPVLKIAVVGRPNVGKSSLVNRLLGEDRLIVTPVPGTTRDAVDTPIYYKGQPLLFIDTAGIRRKSRVKEPLEYYSVKRALKAIERSDVVLLVLDGVEGVTEQDKKIAGFAHERGKGSVILVNKWDLVEKDAHTAQRYEEAIRHELYFLHYAPILFISALTGQRVNRVLPTVLEVGDQHGRWISTGLLNRVVQEAVALTPPPSLSGKEVRIFYATQVKTRPPTFLFFTNRPEDIHISYRRYLENFLRQYFGFEGTPLRLIFRER